MDVRNTEEEVVPSSMYIYIFKVIVPSSRYFCVIFSDAPTDDLRIHTP